MLTRRNWGWLAVAGLVCFGYSVTARETPRTANPRGGRSAEKNLKPGELEAIQQLQELRKERIRGNEKGNASEFAGKWKMRLPAGFEYTIELKQKEDGLLRMTCDGHALNLLGDFACQQNELLLVRADQSAVADYIWIYANGKFVLTKDEQGHGATYRGAVLTRVP